MVITENDSPAKSVADLLSVSIGLIQMDGDIFWPWKSPAANPMSTDHDGVSVSSPSKYMKLLRLWLQSSSNTKDSPIFNIFSPIYL